MPNYSKIRNEAFKKLGNPKDQNYDELLKNLLLSHYGHDVRILVYGDDDVVLCDMTNNEIILDSDLYTIRAREDV